MRRYLQFVFIAVIAALFVPAMAQTTAAPAPASCWPGEVLRGGTGTEFKVELLNSGYVACWRCPDGTRPILADNVDTVLRNIGDRLDTVKAASAPSDAASASWRRHVRYDVRTDPRYATLRAELRARQICGWAPTPAASAAN